MYEDELIYDDSGVMDPEIKAYTLIQEAIEDEEAGTKVTTGVS